MLEIIPGDYPLRLFAFSKPVAIELSFCSGVWDQNVISNDYIWQAETLRNLAEKYSEAGISGISFFYWGSVDPRYLPHMPTLDIPYNYNPTIEPICDVLKEIAKELGTLNWPVPPLEFVRISLVQYTLMLGSSPGGTVDPSPGSYKYDAETEVTVTAVPSTNYRFDKWTGDASGSNNPITITMDSDKSITANFVRQYTLTIAAGSGGTTDPAPGTYTHDSGIQVTVKAIPSTGYQFSGWSGSASGTTNPTTVTMDNDKSVTASFTAIPKPSEEGKKGGCFIATAAYGSPLHPYVNILRDFRDKYLMPTKLGRALVDLYYKYSLSVADLIAKNKVLKVSSRLGLLPLVAFSYSMVHCGPIITAVILVFIFVLPVFIIWFFRKNLP